MWIVIKTVKDLEEFPEFLKSISGVINPPWEEIDAEFVDIVNDNFGDLV